MKSNTIDINYLTKKSYTDIIYTNSNNRRRDLEEQGYRSIILEGMLLTREGNKRHRMLIKNALSTKKPC